ncbi:MAG: hypothetical protein H7Y20_14220, partial [Bryobacteraceae bacterium]|nr:hypothetical protein [Bryobacteraceae bacterium]
MRPKLFWVLLAVVVETGFAQTRSVTDPGVVTTRQTITPAGTPTIFKGRVYGVAFGTSASELYVLNATELFHLDQKANRVLGSWTLGGNPGLQSLRFDNKLSTPLVGLVNQNTGIQLASIGANQRRVLANNLGKNLAGAFDTAAEPDNKGRRVAVLPLVAANKVAIIDLEGKAETQYASTGIAPFGAAVARNGSVVYVTNWGGRLAKSGDLTAPTGLAPTADRVVVDERGVASTGTVTRIDLNTLSTTHTITVGLHPTAV